MVRKYQADAQQVLDDLFRENLIPFKLVAQKVTEERSQEFRISFYDSRLHSVVIDIGKSNSLGDQVRNGVLLRLSGKPDPQEMGRSRGYAKSAA